MGKKECNDGSPMVGGANMPKYIAEAVGTFVLVAFGCGTAMLVGCDAGNGCGYLLTALAFGLSIVAVAYGIGSISGCHVNPAVSLAAWMDKRITSRELGGYVAAQLLGGICGMFVLMAVFYTGEVPDMTGAFGSNGLAGVNGSYLAAFIVEVVLTFVFVTTILFVTSDKFGKPELAGLVIGLTLFFVHILGIGLTGTSVNPARSIAAAFGAMFYGNGEPLACLWVFIVAPLAGAAIAAAVHRFLAARDQG